MSQQANESCGFVPIYRNDGLGDNQEFYGILQISEGRGGIRKIPVLVFRNCITVTVTRMCIHSLVNRPGGVFAWMPHDKASRLLGSAGSVEFRKEDLRMSDPQPENKEVH